MDKLPKLDLNITNRCNFRCVHCAFDSGCKKMDELSLEEIRKVLSETKSLGGNKLDITGGEPLMRKDIEDIITCAKELGFSIELVTNGSLLSKGKLESFKKRGLDSLAVSLDGITYDTYAKIRKVPDHVYSKVLENLKLSIGLGFKVKINTLASKQNYKEIPQITEFCINNSIIEHGLYYFTPVGRGKYGGLEPIDPVEWLNFLRKEMIQYKDKIKVSLEFPLIEKGILAKDLSCMVKGERHHLHILPDGGAYPCAILASYAKELDNIKRTSMAEIWTDNSQWDAYWQSLQCLFSGCSDYCVNFKEFSISKYNVDGYEAVCPLRKFTLYDLEVKK